MIPIYNGEADIPNLLAQLAAQTYPPDRAEYLLVDNGSRDRTAAQISSAVADFAGRGQRLRMLSEVKIQSAYAARNTGIRAATGSILAFTDADCRPQPHWLQKLVEPFAAAAIGIVAGEITALPGTTLLERFADRQNILSQKHTLANAFLPYGQTANLAVRRQALEQAGLFRPYLTTGGDADLCWRIQQQGWQLQFAEHATVQHRHRSSIAELRQQWQRYGRSNRYLHDLHGVPLMRDLSLRDYAHRYGRWLLKELPIGVAKVFAHDSHWSELLQTPLDLFCVQARSQGQKQAQLLDRARQVDRLHSPARPLHWVDASG